MVTLIAARSPPASMSRAAIDEVRSHPDFRAVVTAYATADLARYRGLGTVERWMVSDMGRASLSGTVLALDGLDQLTPALLMTSRPVRSGEVSRGRARLYLQCAVANGLIEATGPGAPLRGATRLAPTARFRAVMTDMLKLAMQAAARLAPDVGPALDRTAQPEFMRAVAARVGTIVASHPDLFPLDSPVQMFQARDGGARVLDDLVIRQRHERARLLEDCEYSHAALARSSCCSRAHVIQLLQDGQARGLLRLDGRRLTVAPELSDSVEFFFAGMLAVARAAAVRTLAGR